MGTTPANPIPKHGDVTGSGAAILWTTDRSGTSLVDYGPTQSYGTAAGDPVQMSASHLVQLSNLAPSTLYHYRVRSLDALGNTLFSFDRTFTTASAGTALPRTGAFDFESGITGWERQTFSDSQAVTAVAHTTERARGGSGSLKVTLDLRGGHANLSQGEAFTAFSNSNPTGTPMDFIGMSNRTITAWVFCPTGSAGDPSKPNGIQLLVKDAAFKSQYGPFVNITENAWFQVSMTAGGAGNAFTDSGFDPARIIICGVKLGAGGGSTAVYSGPVYVDDYAF